MALSGGQVILVYLIMVCAFGLVVIAFIGEAIYRKTNR